MGESKHYLAPWCEEGQLTDARLQSVTDVDKGFAIAAATDLLYVLSGRQFRSGRSVVRPTSIQSGYGNQSFLYPYSSMSGYGAAWGFAAGWAWSAIGMGWWQNGQDLSECVLQGPVQQINDVMVDGASLGSWSPGSPNPNYVLYDRRRLVRTVDTNGMGSGSWPWSQQLQLPPTQPGTWLVDYNWGKNPPASGVAACIALATDLAISLSGTDNTELPSRVVSIAQQGLNVSVGDSLNYIREELTGIPFVDLFLQAYNPGRLRRRAVFLGPNSTQGREMTQFP